MVAYLKKMLKSYGYGAAPNAVMLQIYKHLHELTIKKKINGLKLSRGQYINTFRLLNDQNLK